MSPLPGRLGMLTAKDVMTGQVIHVRQSDTLAEAAQTFRQHHITGAPVVDDAGNLVGIISVWDLIRTDASESAPRGSIGLPAEGASAWAYFEQAASTASRPGDGTVQDRMTRRVTSVGMDASLIAVARAMCDGHWHRVPVVDDQGKLTGIVSTMDILAAMVNAADEPQ